MVTYGGDEVSAVVLDIGSSTTRAGYAGEDCPKHVFPTHYGVVPPTPSSSSSSPTYHLGDSGPNLWRPRQDVQTPLAYDSVPTSLPPSSLPPPPGETDLSRLLDHAFRVQMRLGSLAEHPLLVTEPGWTSKEARERLCEMAFEEWDAPAYYAVDRHVLSAFAAGKGTALVVDIGEGVSSVVPIYDGFVLKKGIRKSALSGSLLTSVLRSTLREGTPTLPSINVTPQYLVKSKTPVPPGQPPKVTLREERLPPSLSSSTEANGKGGDGTDMDVDQPEGEGAVEKKEALTTEGFHQYSLTRTVDDLKETICAVWDGSEVWDESGVATRPKKPYEFPDGYNTFFGRDRFAIPEILFDPERFLPKNFQQMTLPPSPSTIPTIPLSQPQFSIPRLVYESYMSCDQDIKPTLLANIVVTGGTTLMPGFSERLSRSLDVMLQGQRSKIVAAGNTVERKYSAWLGGSILASLGTFQQLWIGKEEYKEQGRGIIHRRAK